MDKSEITYNLPQEKIAQTPSPKRDEAKLLVYKNNQISDSVVKHISEHVLSNTLLIRNRSKVQPVRLFWQKEQTKAAGELVILSGANQPLEEILNQKNIAIVQAVIGNGKRWKEHAKVVITLPDNTFVYAIRKQKVKDWVFEIELQWESSQTLNEILQQAGSMPVPPYITKSNAQENISRYQTVFAKESGSSAAPTAGLHLTQKQFDEFAQKGIQTQEVVLHVGLGTFLPVKTDTLENHAMHTEYVEIPLQTISALINAIQEDKNIFTIGTTSTRSIESLAWIAQLVARGTLKPEEITQQYVLPQFVYHDVLNTDRVQIINGLKKIKEYTTKQNQEKCIFRTALMIIPGYQWQLVNSIMTNFHQPGSTLLALVSSFTNGNWKAIYNHALENSYRFLSYGDASVLYRS